MTPARNNTITLVGGPTTLIEMGGLRILTDPTFDGPGEYPIGSRTLRKLVGPALSPEQVGIVDGVLLSHDQHPDNLDTSGRAFLASAETVLTTGEGAERLGGNAVELSPWQSTILGEPEGRPITVVGVPAHHGPDGTGHLTGSVIGFVLSCEGLPKLYVSGDNASLGTVAEVAVHLGPIDVAVLHVGAARTPLLSAYLTLTSIQAVEAARILEARTVIPVHMEGWSHFTQGPEEIGGAFRAAGEQGRLSLLAPGSSISF